MAKHHPDLIFCRKQAGVAIGRLCEKCDGKCVICDSYVRPCTLVRICDECNYGSYQGRCVICGGPGVSDAYYCKECTIQEKDLRPAGATLRCSRWGFHCGGFSCCRARAVGVRASVVVARGLSSCGSRALEHRLSSCGARA
ncbi:PHD finger-like domain-containing protein 5A isoform X1 [Physeter macrocephalus]|uniref:PHD finger-like domain-containing protein 5A isoform X1 n=1 Tax=Physeter macrocephalus TaxID=9755 RepID=A0A9W2WPW5_PHYMC|nr:PHD finger-like domain-containing protein 5A isoform X1 [Physeter catodon]